MPEIAEATGVEAGIGIESENNLIEAENILIEGGNGCSNSCEQVLKRKPINFRTEILK